ncbi:949_t:CDS:2 [Ambispora gerdemannii]|uniref:949_t:CDS:1 n=1 Tax=Ambispora gerdemannii TaxID=144530 RepID=A0A9N9GIF5_9GLOM|nr:949_t:CDS:2 [Ambispora gerdemannii]
MPNEKSKKQQRNAQYKPKNAKDLSVKKWVFREPKKYALTSSHKPSSTSNNSREATQIVRSHSNNTTSTIEYNHTVITASTTIDDTHLTTIYTNNDKDSTIDDTHLSTINTKKTWSNWASTVINNPQYIFLPNTLEELKDVVQNAQINGKKIQCAVQGHS